MLRQANCGFIFKNKEQGLIRFLPAAVDIIGIRFVAQRKCLHVICNAPIQNSNASHTTPERDSDSANFVVGDAGDFARTACAMIIQTVQGGRRRVSVPGVQIIASCPAEVRQNVGITPLDPVINEAAGHSTPGDVHRPDSSHVQIQSCGIFLEKHKLHFF